MYKQLSGAKKRRLKLKHQALISSLKGSMNKHVIGLVTDKKSHSVTSESNVITDESQPSTSDASIIPDESPLSPTSSVIPDDDESQLSNSESSIIPDESQLSNSESSTIPVVSSEIASPCGNQANANAEVCNNDLFDLSLYISDVGFWPQIITDEFREHFLMNKPFQNIDKISSSKCLIGNKLRCLNESNFFRKRKNNELINREWLVYSPSKKSTFCYICKLFSTSDQALCKSGFSDWKHTNERIQEHENSVVHRNSVLCLSQRLKSSSRIDSALVEEYQAECNYWKKVLIRVVASIKFLCQRGLALFGSDETLESVHNGNFLGILELLSQFDPFIAEHISKHGNPGTGNVNYLSSTIVSEVVEIMSNKVLNVIVKEVQQAKYFGLIVDSTPDITHCDQLSVVVRYVNNNGEPKERFLKFIHIHSHESSYLTDSVLSALTNFNIDIKNCRGQSYDNAYNMSGKYSGLQARIKTLSPLAIYVPCSSHSLNLVGQSSVECCEQAVSFFGLIQNIYTFFSISTHRWEILTSKLKGSLTLKPLASTRWSAAADATKCMRQNYKSIMKCLEEISEDCNEKGGTRHEAKSLLKKMLKFESAVLTVVWDSILQRINKVNKTLQSASASVTILIPLYDSLIKFIKAVRDDFDVYEKEASSLVEADYSVKRRRKIPKSRMLDDSMTDDTNFTERNGFIIQCFYVICDSLISELQKRKDAYVDIENCFGFLTKKTDEETIKKAARHFQTLYKGDIDDDFEEEVYQFFQFISEENLPPESQLKSIRSQNIVHTFPNVDTALQILLTMPISNCTSERSFSALKRIKNRLRSTTKQDKLSSLAILAIESDLTAKLDFHDVIDTFAVNKARKKPF